MSTRCQILFIDRMRSWYDSKDDRRQQLTYKHSDGYPSNVVPMLREFWDWNDRVSHDSLDYTVANWIWFGKLQLARFDRNKANFEDIEERGDFMEEMKKLKPITGYGVTPEEQLQGDIEFLYVVDLDVGTVEVYSLPISNPTDDLDDYLRGRDPREKYRLKEPRNKTVE